MGEILVGTASWADKSLLDSGLFYPKQAKTAEARLRYYSTHFPLVEVDSSYYAMPAPQVAQLVGRAQPRKVRVRCEGVSDLYPASDPAKGAAEGHP